MKDMNKRVNEYFEKQRIHDLKIDIDTVLAEIKKSMGDCKGEAIGLKSLPDCAACRCYWLYKELQWFKKGL